SSHCRSARVQIIIASNVAAVGLGIQGLDQLINYELPEAPQWFTLRVGRTGRIGRPGRAITLVTPADYPKMREIARALGRTLPRETPPDVGPVTEASRNAVEPLPQSRPFSRRAPSGPDAPGP